MTFRTVLFDLDGTLIEHLPAIHRSYAHTLPQLGLPPPTYEQVKRAIGGGLEKAMRNFVTAEQLPEALRIYRAHWDATMLDGAALMPGAEALLAALNERGVTCAVFTNKLGVSARAVCAHLGVMPMLRAVYGAKDTPWLKPEVNFALHGLTDLGADPASTVLVGDSPYDVDAAGLAGMAFAGVTTGTHTEVQLREAGATTLFADLVALRAAWLGTCE
jgi:phosphoglycolate phosphatase